jgi:putative hydrolase of the HAD superfamily
MPEIHAIIFDLGRVLVDIDTDRGFLRYLSGGMPPSGNQLPDGPATSLISECTDEQPPASSSPTTRGTEILEGLARSELFVNFSTGKLSPEAFHLNLCELLNLQLPFAEFARIWCDIFRRKPDMENLVEELSARLPLGLLSDTDPLHWHYIRERVPAVNLIKVTALSFETGALKPAPETYLAAARKLGLKPENCFFTDDLPRNVAGAQAAGMTAVQFTSASQLRQELKSLRILP